MLHLVLAELHFVEPLVDSREVAHLLLLRRVHRLDGLLEQEHMLAIGVELLADALQRARRRGVLIDFDASMDGALVVWPRRRARAASLRARRMRASSLHRRRAGAS